MDVWYTKKLYWWYEQLPYKVWITPKSVDWRNGEVKSSFKLKNKWEKDQTRLHKFVHWIREKNWLRVLYKGNLCHQRLYRLKPVHKRLRLKIVLKTCNCQYRWEKILIQHTISNTSRQNAISFWSFPNWG